MACALAGGRIRWLMNSRTGLAGTQSSFSCFSSGHLCAPFTICLLNWSRLFFYVHVRDCYAVVALAPGPFSNSCVGEYEN